MAHNMHHPKISVRLILIYISATKIFKYNLNFYFWRSY